MLNRLSLLRALCVVALAASSASLADQSLGDGTFCGFESGCESVTNSEYGQLLGVPLPYFGLIGFTLILALSLIGSSRSNQAARALALVAAAAGVTLIAIQVAVLRQVCQLCLVADLAAVLIGIASVRPFPTVSPSSGVRAAWLVAAVVAIFAPLVIAFSDVQPEPPDWVKAEWVPDRITVVEVTDFECEHCRRADEYIREVLKTRPDVRFVRIPVEMPRHANSRTAAIAYHAAKAQGRGNEMAEALFASEDLKPEVCRALAAKLGLNLAEYDRAVADPEVDRSVRLSGVAARNAGPGVPLIWIQSHVIFGSPTIENFDGPLGRARPYRPK